MFLLLHLCVYGGATAYNSSYDRDRGPVGGMKYPPECGLTERYGGLMLQVFGVAGMSLWGWVLALCAAVMVVMGTAYSHPRWRWKARPLLSLGAVALGQGAIPFYMGFLAATSLAMPGWQVALPAAASALLITGLYPLTQVYQIDEDDRRGDRTFAVRYGPDVVFRFARFSIAGGVALTGLSLASFGIVEPSWLAALPLGYAIFWLTLGYWQRRFDAQTVYQNHDWAFRLSAAASLLFWVFCLAEIIANGS